jgi:predicted dithiol-disulfide oxidoreductase (DUF899 family)
MGEGLHEIRFPGESAEYRRARDALLKAEVDLRRRVEAVAKQRRELPRGGEVPEDFTFEEWDATVGNVREVRLSELFEDDKDTLLVYSFMFIGGPQEPIEVPCPSCTSIIDGIDGAVPHITQRLSLAVVAKAPIERFSAHARARGWRHARILSSANTIYNREYSTEAPDGSQWPMATVFTRRDGRIRHFWSSELFYALADPDQHPRHVDFVWPLWAVLDRTPDGRGGDWTPRLTYS